MEIHAPEEPIRSWKGFCLHIGTVTIGILIAVSLDGALEWRHNRRLVSEAAENLQREMNDNRAEILRFLGTVKNTETDYEAVGEIVAGLRRDKAVGAGYRFRAYTMQLADAAWRTAQASGAVAHMDYKALEKYARVYGLQSRLVQLQDGFLEAALEATPDADPASWSEARFEYFKRQAAAADVRARAEEHAAMRLAQELANSSSDR